jgi:hypothetical protein
MRQWLLLVVVLVPVPACAGPACAGDTPTGKWIVVTAPAFRDALEPLCEHRKAQGLDVEVVQTTDVLTAKEIAAGDGAKLKAHLNRRSRDARGPVYILLVGAVEAGKLADVDRKVLPPLRGTVSRMKDQPCDHGYGCLGDDLQPAAAVGRLPARSEDEARQMVQKTLTFERDRTPGEWRRQVTVLAGAPAFNPQVDALVERIAISRLGKLSAVPVRRRGALPGPRRLGPDEDRPGARDLRHLRLQWLPVVWRVRRGLRRCCGPQPQWPRGGARLARHLLCSGGTTGLGGVI